MPEYYVGPLAITPSAVVWSPLLLTGIAAFWRADMGVTQSSGNVTAWADQTSNANTLTVNSGISGTSPTYGATGFNTSYPGVTFAGTSLNALESALNSSLASSTKASFWILLTVNADETTYPGVAGFLGNGAGVTTAPSIDIYNNTGSQYAFQVGAVQFGIVYFGLPNTWLLTFALDGSNINWYWNSNTPQTPVACTSTVGGSGQYWFGAINANGAPAFTLAAAGWCSNYTMTATDVNNLSIWCNSTFGTSV